jgi:hypothetical protein
VIDFGKQKLFEHAPGQHNLIFVIEKSDGKNSDLEKWSLNQPKVIEVKVGAGLNGANHEERIAALVSRISENMSKDKFEDDLLRIYTSGKTHGDLLKKSWNFKCSISEVELITKLETSCSTLETEYCMPKTGIQPGVLTVTPKIKKKYFSDVSKIREGAGVFTLSANEANSLGAAARPFLKKLTKSSDIFSFSSDPKSELYLLYTHKGNSPEKTQVMDHLKKFKPILETKRETQKGTLPWWSNHWPRDPNTFEMPNLLVPYRSKWNSFSCADSPIYGLTEVYFIPDKSMAKLQALEALMNSELAHFWFAIEGKHKGAQIELLDFGHFPIPELTEKSVRALGSVAESCRKSFRPLIDLNVCPRDVLHFGVSEQLFEPLDHLKKDISTLKRFETAGIAISGRPSNETAVLKRISRSAKGATLTFTGKASKVSIGIGRLNQDDYQMVVAWIEKYAKDMSWSAIYTELAFPKNSKSLDLMKKNFLEQLEKKVVAAAESYQQLNDLVFETYGLSQKDIKLVSKRVQLRIEDLKTSSVEVETDSENEADEEAA